MLLTVLFIHRFCDSLAAHDRRRATTKQQSQAGPDRASRIRFYRAARLQRAYVCGTLLRTGGKVLPSV